MQNLQNELIDLLQSEDNLVVDGQLNKNKIVELALKVDVMLIKALIKHPKFKAHFFQEVDGVLVFDKIEFQRFVNNKSFLPDSYTAFKNKIGLTINDGSTDNYLNSRNDVVLVWPHKDCVLEGGQTKEEQERDEIFWNETLAPDEVDRLLDPKVLTGWKMYNKEGEHPVTDFTGAENLIIKGNNLLALSLLKKRYQGQIKLIYIDPPYNTGSDSFQYHDHFNHSTWLTFMKNRLELSKQLLSEAGSIFISIDENEVGYLQVLCDEIFGRENRANLISVKRGSVTGHKAINPGAVNVTEYVLGYAKNKSTWKPNRVQRERSRNERYNVFIRNREQEIDKWQFTSLLNAFSDEIGVPKAKLKKHLGDKFEDAIFEFIKKNANAVVQLAYPDKDKVSKEAKEVIVNSEADPEKVFHIKRENEPDLFLINGQRILFYSDRLFEINGVLVTGEPISDFWDDVLPNDLHNEGGVSFKKGKKSEKLIQRIIELTTNEGDWVLDYHLGSGTTSCVALKLNRKFIGVEQLEYNENGPIARLKNTINGEQSGVSKLNNWKGGGSFVYVKLKEHNQYFIDCLQFAKSKDEVLEVWEKMHNQAILSYQFDKATFNERLAAFKTAPLEDMKKYLVEVLDKNQLYVNYSEMNDSQYQVSEEDKKLNDQFFNRKK